jgi:hypothetical protein
MLNTALSAVVGVLGIAVAADWLSWQKRTIKRLSAHADLASALPEGQAKDALEARLKIEVDLYLDGLDRRYRRKGAVLILGMTAAGVLLAAGGVVANLVGRVDYSWATAVTWVGLSIEVFGVVLMKRLDSRLELQTDSPEPLPGDALNDVADHDEPASCAGVPDEARRDVRTSPSTSA